MFLLVSDRVCGFCSVGVVCWGVVWGGGGGGWGGTAGIQTLKYSVAMKVCPAVTFFEVTLL